MFHIHQAIQIGMIRLQSNYSISRERLAWKIVDNTNIDFVPVYTYLSAGYLEEDILLAIECGIELKEARSIREMKEY